MSPTTESLSSKFLADTEAIEELRKLLKAAKVVSREHGITLYWHDRNDYLEGWATLFFVDDTFHWAMLQAPRAGTMTRLAGVLPDFFRDYGFARITAPGWPGSWRWLEAIGLEKVTSPQEWMTPELLSIIGCEEWQGEDLDLYTEDFTKRRTNFEEYVAWKQGEGTEPAWHQTVAGRRKSEPY